MKEEVGEQRESSDQVNGEQATQPNTESNGNENLDSGVSELASGEQEETVKEDNHDETPPVDKTNSSENREINGNDTDEKKEDCETNDETVVNESSGVNGEEPSANGEVSDSAQVVIDNTETTVPESSEEPTTNGDSSKSSEKVAVMEGDKSAQEEDQSEIVDETAPDEVQFPRERRLTAYERLSNDLTGDHKVQKEITLGKRIGFYRIRGELGSGNFSQVKMGIHALTKEKVAVKILDKTKLDQKTQRLLSREISSMDQMHHPNIIRLYEVVETLAKLHIVMEYAAGGELFHKISNEGKIPEAEAKVVYSQVLAAIEHMHSKNIIHRDLKAENVFYAGPHFVKVGDFGFSTCSPPEQTLNTFCGSPPYAAPELFKDEHYFGVFVDIWAMGILLYFMVCGIMPFRADTVSKLKKCILEGHYVIPNYVSDSCQFLIRGILKPIPQDRFSLAEIKRSDWLEGQEFPEELPPYNMNPSGEGAILTEEELETRAILHELGINEAHIKECHGKDSRSSINGTYRIVLHKVQRKRCGNVESGPDFEPETIAEAKETKGVKSRKTSKFCIIL